MGPISVTAVLYRPLHQSYSIMSVILDHQPAIRLLTRKMRALAVWSNAENYPDMFSWKVIFRHLKVSPSSKAQTINRFQTFRMRHLLVRWAPAEGIQQLVAISSWREKRFHCKRIKGNLGDFRLTKYNKLTTGLWWETGESEPNSHRYSATALWTSYWWPSQLVKCLSNFFSLKFVSFCIGKF